MANKPRLVVLASGTEDGGGSGAESLVLASRNGVLDAEVVAFVSNHARGGVYRRARELGVTFLHFPASWTAPAYRAIVGAFNSDYVALSGWLKPAVGLDPRTTFNIHPGPLNDVGRRFGGKGMYGHHVHDAVLKAYQAGEITHSAVSMHFVTERYDAGPVFFHMPVKLFASDTADSIGKRVNMVEHLWQATITNIVVQGKISWDGEDPSSLRVPDGYDLVP